MQLYKDNACFMLVSSNNKQKKLSITKFLLNNFGNEKEGYKIADKKELYFFVMWAQIKLKAH